MASKPIPTWFFAAVVVRAGDRFVLVRETGTKERWGLPGGKLEPGESFLEAARRETREETGLEIEVQGILGFEHTAMPDGWSRMGIALLGRADPEAPLKQEPDEESLGASWFGLEDLDALPLRSHRVERLVRLAFDGLPLVPLDRVEGFLFGAP